MKHGRSRFGVILSAVMAGAMTLGGPLAMSSALAQKPTAAHAKAKPKKPKAPAKSPHHAGGAAKAGGKGHAAQGSRPAGAAAPGAAAPRPAAPKDAAEALAMSLPVQRVTLENGLRVVMNVDKTSPAIAVAVAYDVGSRDEAKGRSGSARLLERMMFDGSANVLRGDHARLVMSHGGQATSRTSAELTVFSQSLPASELALGLWLEADRMKSLSMSAESFEAERRAAQEEARAALSSAPASTAARLQELIFQGSWAYEHSADGSPDDLGAVTLDELKQLHAAHYGPNNAALVLAGDFDPDEAMTLIHKHFDAIPRATVAAFNPADGEVPEQTAQRTAVVRGDSAKTAEIRYGWAIPPSASADSPAVAMAAIVVAEGESSRLYQALVRDKSLADDVSVSVSPMSRGPGSLQIVAKLAEGAKVMDAQKLIEGELSRIGATPPTEAEMKKARRRAEARLIVGDLSTITSRADRLADYEMTLGSALRINEELPKIAAVTADDVRRAAAQYLGPTRRTLVETIPMNAEPPAHAATAGPPVSHEGAAPVAHAEPKKPAGHEGHDAGAKKTASKSSGAKAKKGAAKAGEGAKKKPSSSAKSKKAKKP